MICKEDNLSLKELLCLNPLCLSKRTGRILSTSQQMWNLPGQDQGHQPVPALAWSCFQAQEGLGQLLVPFSGRPPARGHSQRTLASPPVPKGLFLCPGRRWQLQAGKQSPAPPRARGSHRPSLGTQPQSRVPAIPHTCPPRALTRKNGSVETPSPSSLRASARSCSSGSVLCALLRGGEGLEQSAGALPSYFMGSSYGCPGPAPTAPAAEAPRADTKASSTEHGAGSCRQQRGLNPSSASSRTHSRHQRSVRYPK